MEPKYVSLPDMENTEDTDLIAWIDAASYEELLRKWRWAPSGDPFFRGAVGVHYSETMVRRREEVGPAEHVAASKRIGW